jgi:hypothetical protein
MAWVARAPQVPATDHATPVNVLRRRVSADPFGVHTCRPALLLEANDRIRNHSSTTGVIESAAGDAGPRYRIARAVTRMTVVSRIERSSNGDQFST